MTPEEKEAMTKVGNKAWFYFLDNINKDIKDNESNSEIEGIQANKTLENPLSSDFISEKNAFTYAVATKDPEALAYLALNDPKTFFEHATPEEKELAREALSNPYSSLNRSDIEEKYKGVLDDIQSGRIDAPYIAEGTERFSAKNIAMGVGKAIVAAPILVGGAAGATTSMIATPLVGIPVGLGAGVVTASAMITGTAKAAISVGETIGEVIEMAETSAVGMGTAAATAGAALIYSATSEGYRKHEEWETNPEKYVEREANIIQRNLDKPIEEQDVMD